MPARANALRAAALLALLAACGEAEEPPAPEVRPVRVVTIEERAGGDAVSLTGTVQAEIEVNLAFRIDGRMTERLVERRRPGRAGPARRAARSAERGERAARRAGRPRRGEGPAGRGAEQLRAPERAARGRLDHARALRRGAPDARDRAVARGRRPGAALHRPEPGGLHRARRGLGRRRDGGRRRARRGRAGRPHDRAGRARGRPRCRLRRAGAGQGPGPCRSRDRGRPDHGSRGAARSAGCARWRRAPTR